MATRQPPKRKVSVKKKPQASTLTRDEQISKTKEEYEQVAASPYFRDTLGVKSPVSPKYMGKNSTLARYYPSRDFIFFNPDEPLDEVSLGKTPVGSKTAKSVLTHEGAHALDNKDNFPSFYSVKRPQFKVPFDAEKGLVIEDALKSSDVRRVMPDKTIDRFNMQDKTSLQPKTFFGVRYGKGFQPMDPSEVKAIQALDPYYAIAGISAREPDTVITDPDESFAQAYTNAAGFLSETAGDTTGFREKLGRYEGNTPGAGAIVRDLLRGRPIYRQHPLKGVIR